uniref:GYF domain-containing protein n=1 Tax=Pristionchus pacificus TaxID=54126 RepID=A0A2A6CSW3_PRIPA|eukprot:PDM81285.1 hypothetical protein PRIPAC_36288 [Pristionchus pacificus]
MEALFSRILDGGDGVFYRHEQKGDEDLTEVEKREILSRVFEESKPVFLQRYLRWIQKSDESLFAGCSENPLVEYFLGKLDRREPSEAQKRNRRYTALERLKKEAKRLHLRPTITATQANGWAGLLEQFEESGDVARRRAAASDVEWEGAASGQRDAPNRLLAHVENAFEMEEEEEEEERERAAGEGTTGMGELQREVNGIIKEMDDETEREEREADDDEMEEDDDVPMETLRDEFIAIMYERFLAGKDAGFFDYSMVDEDERAEEMDEIAERDREEAWVTVATVDVLRRSINDDEAPQPAAAATDEWRERNAWRRIAHGDKVVVQGTRWRAAKKLLKYIIVMVVIVYCYCVLQTYGPYKAREMHTWGSTGYFNESLPVKTENDDCFHPIGEWMGLMGGANPFAAPSVPAFNVLMHGAQAQGGPLSQPLSEGPGDGANSSNSHTPDSAEPDFRTLHQMGGMPPSMQQQHAGRMQFGYGMVAIDASQRPVQGKTISTQTLPVIIGSKDASRILSDLTGCAIVIT